MGYVINGQQSNIGIEPFVHNGRNYVPLEEVTRALGGTVSWNDATKTAIATIGQWTANVQMANENVDVSGTQVRLSAPPMVEDGTMYVPWDFFRDAYGYKAEMNDGTLSISL